jgi:hypothetical protein
MSKQRWIACAMLVFIRHLRAAGAMRLTIQSTGDGRPVSVVPPSVVLNYIIKT